VALAATRQQCSATRQQYSATQPTMYFENGIGCLISRFCQIKQKLNLTGQIFSLDKLPN
jgi:hypothetical protein